MGILAVILAIIALVSCFLTTIMFGTTGFIITLVLAAAAIALAIVKRVKAGKGGIPAIVIAVLAILVGFGFNNLWSSIFHTLHDRAVESMPDSLWAQVSEDYNHGLMGIVSNVPTDEASINKLVDEMSQLAKLSDKE